MGSSLCSLTGQRQVVLEAMFRPLLLLAFVATAFGMSMNLIKKDKPYLVRCADGTRCNKNMNTYVKIFNAYFNKDSNCSNKWKMCDTPLAKMQTDVYTGHNMHNFERIVNVKNENCNGKSVYKQCKLNWTQCDMKGMKNKVMNIKKNLRVFLSITNKILKNK